MNCARISLIAAALLLAASAGCNPASYRMEPITFTAKYQGGGQDHYIRVTKFVGRSGASVGKILPGKYVASGTFDLGKSTLDGGEIQLKFEGKYSAQTKSKDVFKIPKNVRRGQFEVWLVVEKFKGGKGRPVITYSLDGSTQDTVILN